MGVRRRRRRISGFALRPSFDGIRLRAIMQYR
jgi:hypothetical protein